VAVFLSLVAFLFRVAMLRGARYLEVLMPRHEYLGSCVGIERCLKREFKLSWNSGKRAGFAVR
jgi:hypothetical protein